MFRTRRPLTITYGPTGSRIKHTVDLPAGLMCKPIPDGTTAGKFWIDEFPASIFGTDTLALHDAVHYGIVVEPDDVVGENRFTVEPGRQIHLDGGPFIGIMREGETIPAVADDFTRLIARLLNESADAAEMLRGKIRRK